MATLRRAPTRAPRLWGLVAVGALCTLGALYAARRAPAPSATASATPITSLHAASPPLTPEGTTRYDEPAPHPSTTPAPMAGTLRYDAPVAPAPTPAAHPRRRPLRRDARGDLVGGALPGGGTATYDR